MASGLSVTASKWQAVYQTKGTVITTNFTGTVTVASLMEAGFPWQFLVAVLVEATVHTPGLCGNRP
jgi:hypothetical protein